MLEKIKILIEDEERPESDIDQLFANLASKRTNRIRAEQNLLEAKQALGIAMGLSVDEISSSPLPADDPGTRGGTPCRRGPRAPGSGTAARCDRRRVAVRGELLRAGAPSGWKLARDS